MTVVLYKATTYRMVEIDIFILLPKKQFVKSCEDKRMISLMNHLLKIFLRIIHARIRNKIKQNFDDTQLGFRNGFGTIEALLSLNILLQKCLDQRKDVIMCFIEYQRAFDCVKYDELMTRLICII